MTDPAPTTTTSPTTEHEPGLATTSGATTANVYTDDSNDTSNSREELRKTSGIPGVFSDVISFAKGVFSDFSQPLASQSLVTRLCCFPCQCGLACSHSCISFDFDSIMTILCCCPVSKKRLLKRLRFACDEECSILIELLFCLFRIKLLLSLSSVEHFVLCFQHLLKEPQQFHQNQRRCRSTTTL